VAGAADYAGVAEDQLLDADDDSVPAAERIQAPTPRYTPLYLALSTLLLATESWLRSHGGRGLRYAIRVVWIAVAFAGLILLVGPVINKPLTLDDITESASTATQNWIAREFAVDYRVSHAADGSMVVDVEERIAAFFPEQVSEAGIDRVLAIQYEGQALDPSAISATLDGAAIDVVDSSTPEQLTVRLGNGNRLEGDHAFVLNYRLHNLAYAATDEASELPVDLLTWDVFGPSWPQGSAGIDVTLSLPKDVNDRLIRPPRGSVAWLIAGAGGWLEPEPTSADDQTVSYNFTNSQRLPPHSEARFTLSFESGTFTMPPPTALHWVQVFGPLAPLAILALTLLFALAARAVAWSDERGRPWYVAQSSPPDRTTPRMAAQILGEPRSMELAEALKAIDQGGEPQKPQRVRLLKAAQIARRTGLLGDRPRALSRYFTAMERRAQLSEGIRRVPRGFVRDLFIAAPIALTLVQWGIIRQLSYQVVLAVVWWPVAFVLVSSVLAAVILWIALSVRPLTRKGALAKQYLMGIAAYADQTTLLKRAEPTDKLLPYVVLLSPPRAAGHEVRRMIEESTGDKLASSGWQTREFLSGTRLAIMALSVALVIGAITVAALLPAPYRSAVNYQTYGGDLPGSHLTKVQSFDAIGTLTRAADGNARVDVTEHLTVDFGDGTSSRVPQFAQQWPDQVDGQSLGLEVTAVHIDGGSVPFVVEPDADTVLMRTTLPTVLTGPHNVDINYVVTSAAVAANSFEQGGALVDRVRWAALLDGWQHNSDWGDEPVPDPIRVEFRIAEDLVPLVITGGWISKDTDAKTRVASWQPSVVPFDPPTTEGGATAYILNLTPEGEHAGWPLNLTVDDVGARADFAPGTFVGPSAAALAVTGFRTILPVVLLLPLAAAAILIGALGAHLGAHKRRRVFESGPVRDLVWWLSPASTLAVCILFVWVAASASGNHSMVPLLGFSTLAAIAASALGLVLTRRSRWSNSVG
jgi:hypothetical protein